ncbi:MAG TPA: hypothetical protein VGB67_04065 [Fibrella sp.]|jgi:hypothetical protein
MDGFKIEGNTFTNNTSTAIAMAQKEAQAKKEERQWRFVWRYHEKSLTIALMRGWRRGLELALSLYNTTSVGILFKVGNKGSENGYQLHIGILWFRLYLSVKGRGPLSNQSRVTSLMFHHFTLWWELWQPRDEWNSGQPWYRKFSWHFADTILGPIESKSTLIREREIGIPMPEKTYLAKTKLEQVTATRPRWPWKLADFTRCNVDIDEGIPYIRKGYDDARFSHAGPARDEYEIIGRIVEDILRGRPEGYRVPEKR